MTAPERQDVERARWLHENVVSERDIMAELAKVREEAERRGFERAREQPEEEPRGSRGAHLAEQP